METTCAKCGGTLEAGFATADGLIGGNGVEGETPKLLFIVLGKATSANPITAFKQGLSDEPANRSYGIRGFRCSQCGAVELYANRAIPDGR